MNRRTFAAVGSFGAAAAVVGFRAVSADNRQSTPAASPEATPGTPGATPAASGGDAVTIIAKDIAFEPTEFSIPADTDVKITLDNEGSLQHDFNIEDTDFATELLNGGESETITVNLEAGEYVYFCSVPGHREAGMEGTLTVE
jgi:uncharacterized cupredoxin-like copper-binding protein